MNEGLRLRFSELIDLIYTHTEPTVRQVLANRVDVLFNGVSREIEKVSSENYFDGYRDGGENALEESILEGRKIGFEKAISADKQVVHDYGYRKGFQDGNSNGLSDGYDLGYEEGRNDGFEEGVEVGEFFNYFK